jgi:hypothetical protein
MIKFECLKRSRMAKDDVLVRVLKRKISDGHWVGLGEHHKQSVNFKKALQVIGRYRELFIQNKLVADIKPLHEICDELYVGYDYIRKIHYIDFKSL